MMSGKRFLGAVLLASIVNTLLMVTVFRSGNAIANRNAFSAEYWSAELPPVALIGLVQLFSLGFTGSGLFLLLGIAHHIVPKITPGWVAKGLFVASGAGLGFVITKLLAQTEIGSFFGGITALVFTVLCPEWFDERRRKLL